MTSAAEAKALYQRFVDEAVNTGNFDLLDEMLSPDYLDHSTPPGVPPGIAGVKAVFAMFRTAFPDVKFTVEQMLFEDDFLATRVSGQGTQNGPFMGAPASGKHATWSSLGIFRVTDGKLAEHWGVPDLLGLLTQIGMISPPGGPGHH